ncbi:hypothetical protein D9M71_404040 [compost metagenome]
MVEIAGPGHSPPITHHAACFVAAKAYGLARQIAEDRCQQVESKGHAGRQQPVPAAPVAVVDIAAGHAHHRHAGVRVSRGVEGCDMPTQAVPQQHQPALRKVLPCGSQEFRYELLHQVPVAVVQRAVRSRAAFALARPVR